MGFPTQKAIRPFLNTHRIATATPFQSAAPPQEDLRHENLRCEIIEAAVGNDRNPVPGTAHEKAKHRLAPGMQPRIAQIGRLPRDAPVEIEHPEAAGYDSESQRSTSRSLPRLRIPAASRSIRPAQR